MMTEFEIQEALARQEGHSPRHQIAMSVVNDISDDQRIYNAPRCNEVAVIFQNAMGEPPFHRDIRVHSRAENRTQLISFLHKKCDAMTYPLLFPYGDSGFKINLTVNRALSSRYHLGMNNNDSEEQKLGMDGISPDAQDFGIGGIERAR